MLTYDPAEPKRCIKCREWKDPAEFATRTYPNGNVGLQGWCMTCMRVYCRDDRKRNARYKRAAPPIELPPHGPRRFADLPAPMGITPTDSRW